MRLPGIPRFRADRLGEMIFGLILIYSLLFSLIEDAGARRSGVVFLICLIGLGVFKPMRHRLMGGLRDALLRIPLWVILFGGLLVRLVWALYSGAYQTSDFFGYQREAYLLLHGAPLLNPLKPHGAAFLYATCYGLIRFGNVGAHLIVALVSASQIGLLYVILSRTARDRSVGRIGALILAVWPEHILYCNLLSSEVPFTALVLCSYMFYVLSLEGEGGRRLAFLGLSGFLLGWAHWVRPLGPILLIAPLLVEIFGRKPKRRFSGARMPVLIVAFLLPLAVLCRLNLRLIGVASPNPAQMSGWSLLLGTGVRHGGQWNLEDRKLLMREAANLKPVPDENRAVSVNRLAWELALRRIASNPGAFVRMVLTQKLWQLWPSAGYLGWSLDTSVFKARQDTISFFADNFHRLVIFLATVLIFIGMNSASGSFNIIHGFLWAAVAATGLHVFFEMSPRYHHPFIPLFPLILAYYGRRFWSSAEKIVNPPNIG
jgi:hypothetical protein